HIYLNADSQNRYCMIGLPQLVPILPNCIQDLVLTTTESGLPVWYQAANSITLMENYYSHNYNVDMIAGNVIQILPNSYIKGELLAKIEENCSDRIIYYPRPAKDNATSIKRSINIDKKENKITSEEFHIYPNPSSEIINISATNIINNVTITDLNGRTVKQVTVG